MPVFCWNIGEVKPFGGCPSTIPQIPSAPPASRVVRNAGGEPPFDGVDTLLFYPRSSGSLFPGAPDAVPSVSYGQTGSASCYGAPSIGKSCSHSWKSGESSGLCLQHGCRRRTFKFREGPLFDPILPGILIKPFGICRMAAI